MKPGLAFLAAAACAVSVTPEPPYSLEVIATTPVASFDSLPEPRIEVVDGRIIVRAHFGLGGAGQRLTPFGTIDSGVVDLLVSANMPSEQMGATVLTDYSYVLTTSVLKPGTWRVRLHQAIAEEGDPELLLDRDVVVPR